MNAERIVELRALCERFNSGETSALAVAGVVPELLDAYEKLLSRTARPARVYVDPPPTSQKDWVIEDIKVGSFAKKTGEPSEPPNPRVHAPRLTRTLMDGPGNHTDVRGCSCGANTFGAEAFAAHIGWPIEAVRAVLTLVGLADDALYYPHDRRDLWQRIDRCLEINCSFAADQEIRRGQESIHLRAYRDITRVMLDLDKDSSISEADALRDVLDLIWIELTDAERATLNQAKTP